MDPLEADLDKKTIHQNEEETYMNELALLFSVLKVNCCTKIVNFRIKEFIVHLMGSSVSESI